MKLVIRSGQESGQQLNVGPSPVVVGRDPSANLTISDGRVSWRHVRLTVLPDGRTILEDLGSTNGTFVNGQRVQERAFLSGGERLSLGGVELDCVGSGPTVLPSPQPAAAPAGGDVRYPPLPQPGPFAPPAPPRPQSPSVIQRVMLQRSVRRANILAAIAVIASLALVAAVVASGVLTPRPLVTPAPVTPAPATVADIASAAEPSTVLVIGTRDGERGGSGTGWVWDADRGLIVTNHHVVNGDEEFQVGVDSMLAAEVVAGAPCEDLAVLVVRDASGLRTMPLGSQSDLRRGDTAIALGYPLNASPTDDLAVTVGNVSAVQISYDPGPATDVPAYSNVVQVTTPINPGNSGGPLLDLGGKLIGVNSAGPPVEVEATNYAIGVDRVKEIVPTLAEGKSMWWTGFGFDQYITQDLIDLDAQTRQGLEANRWPLRTGIYITHAVEGTDLAAVQLPAFLTAVNGTEIDGTLEGYCAAVASVSAPTIRLTVYTVGSDQPIEVDVPFR